MENTEKVDEQEYLDGFNTGYIMAKYSPEIGELIHYARGSGVRLKGMQAGKLQHDKENEPVILPKWLNKNIERENGKNLTKTNKKDIEPDI